MKMEINVTKIIKNLKKISMTIIKIFKLIFVNIFKYTYKALNFVFSNLIKYIVIVSKIIYEVIKAFLILIRDKRRQIFKFIFGTILTAIFVISLYGNNYRFLQVNASEVYKVYIDGKYEGNVDSEEVVHFLLESKRQELEQEFDVVYYPENIKVEKVKTIDVNLRTQEDLFNLIQEKAIFTTDGYTIFIDGEPKLNVLSIDKFQEAVKQVITTFVSEDDYHILLNNITRTDVPEYGKLVEDIYVNNNFEFKKDKVSVNDVFIDKNSISQFLIYGKIGELETYTVSNGENLKSVAKKYNMSLSNILTINPDYRFENTILSNGDEVVIEYINPILNVIVEEHLVQKEAIDYVVKYDVDTTRYKGIQNYVKQQGVKGSKKVTYKLKSVNGDNIDVIEVDSKVLQEPIPKIIVLGGKTSPSVGSLEWKYPGHGIIPPGTGYFGWRWGRMHYGIDIAGGGYGSPIYASDNGVVQQVGYNYDARGNFVIINHNNGYTTHYFHLHFINVKVGDTTPRGWIIGGMGNTGRSSGPHLHFEIRKNGVPVNPLIHLW